MYLLGAVGSKEEHGLVAIGQGDTVHERPDVTKTSGRELHTGREAKLRMSWEFRVGLAVVKEVLPRKMALERGDKVLGRNTVTCGKSGTIPNADPSKRS